MIATGDFNSVNNLSGRRQIFTTAERITAENVISELNAALVLHTQNCLEMDYLYWYRRGIQPILDREKSIRPEIKNCVVENHADEIVSFKNGYFLTQPAFYISRTDDAAGKVAQLNEYLYRSGKQQVDNEVVDWFHTVGIGTLYVEPNRNDKETPVSCYALDPRSAFVVYSRRPGSKPVMGVNVVMTGENEAVFDVFTEGNLLRVAGGFSAKTMTNEPIIATGISLISVEPNPIGKIPIIEYRYNSVNMGAFESVIPLLDAVNDVMSNRIDGIEQFIQSLAVAVNCEFEEGVTANSIRKAGMIVLKSVGENKADFKILSEQLDQGQTQVLVDYLYQQILTICGMPSTTKGGASTSDTGVAVLARDGWYQADTVARNTEDLFRKSNRYFDEIFTSILSRVAGLDISLTDFELQFTRNETANILSKAQAATTLLAAGLAPEIAFAKSGVSNDPMSDVLRSEKYLKLRWGNPEKDSAEEESAKKEDVEVVEENKVIE